MQVPFHRTAIGEAEVAAVADSMRSGWLTSGPNVQAFEEAFAGFVGAKFAIAVNSCTAAMHLALEAHNIGPGDCVLTTDYTFTASAEVIRYLGATPIFADIEPGSRNISLQAVAQKLAQHGNIRAILPVHIAGYPCDISALRALIGERPIALIEDAAHALPAELSGQRVGSLGDATCFSFYATKPLCTGEGGMLTTDHANIAARARTMRLHGIDADVYARRGEGGPSWFYQVVAPGFKYNMTDLAAAMGLQQLTRQVEMRQRRAEIAAAYNAAFADLAVVLPHAPPAGSHAWHLYMLQLHPSIDRDALSQTLADRGVATSVHFIPLHRHPYWRQSCALHESQFPISEETFQHTLSLPIFPDMTEPELAHVIDTVCSAVSTL